MAKLIIELGTGKAKAKIESSKKKIQTVIDEAVSSMKRAEYEKPEVNLAAQLLLRADMSKVSQDVGTIKDDISNTYIIRGEKDDLIDLVNAAGNFLVAQLNDEEDRFPESYEDEEDDEDDDEVLCIECEQEYTTNEDCVCDICKAQRESQEQINASQQNSESLIGANIQQEPSITDRGYCNQCDASVDVLSNGLCATCGSPVDEIYSR